MRPAIFAPRIGCLFEFIVRADDGATLSIVQANTASFRTGDRVVILRDDTARLAPPGQE